MSIDSLPKNTKVLRHATNIAQNLGIGKQVKTMVYYF